MRRGFTLIELLAVIVILAIIALIATPIVLDIINDSRESANLRSAEMYLKALETSISTYSVEEKKLSNKSYNIIENGNLCIEYSGSECINELKVEVNGEVPESGKIEIKDGKILYVSGLEYKNNKISTGYNGELVYSNNRIVCKAVTKETKTTGMVPKGKYEKGDEYRCKVNLIEDTIYTFFILSINEDNTVNLLMERNMYYNSETQESGLIVDSNHPKVQWQESGLNADGPTTIMNYLYGATSNWTNIPNIEINYTDNESSNGSYGYSSITTNGNITTIIKKDGKIASKYENLKARLPYKSEINIFDKTNHTNLWMYNYLSYYVDVKGEKLQNVSAIGYWTLTSNKTINNFAWRANFRGELDSGTINVDNTIGIRPVITLEKSMLLE